MTLLTVYLVFLFAIPSQFVVASLGGAATPFQVVGIGCLLWWVWARIKAFCAPCSSLGSRSGWPPQG